MKLASENMMYEDAAKYRDQLDVINNFIINEKKYHMILRIVI